MKRFRLVLTLIAVILWGCSQAPTATPEAATPSPSITTPIATATFAPDGDSASRNCGDLATRMGDRALLDQIAALPSGASPDTVTSQVTIVPTQPLTQYQPPNANKSVLVWQGKTTKGETFEIRVGFLNAKLYVRSIGVMDAQGSLCSWSTR